MEQSPIQAEEHSPTLGRQRSNATWTRSLRSEDEGTISELREILLRNLRKAYQHDGRVDDAFLQDVVQDAVMKTLERLDQFEGRSRFLTWATSIAIHEAASELRRSRWKNVSLDEIMEAGHSPSISSAPHHSASSDGESPEMLLNRQTIIEHLHLLMARDLSARQRTALVAELKGMSQEQIATQLGSNRNALYKLTHDARKKLRRGLEDAGFSFADIMTSKR